MQVTQEFLVDMKKEMEIRQAPNSFFVVLFLQMSFFEVIQKIANLVPVLMNTFFLELFYFNK